jgi:predicted ATPase
LKIKNIHIQNFKSIADLEIIEPNPFTVFVGPNGSGKSNIFEALEFNLSPLDYWLKLRLFGGQESISNHFLNSNRGFFNLNLTDIIFVLNNNFYSKDESFSLSKEMMSIGIVPLDDSLDGLKDIELKQKFDHFQQSFSRIFVGSTKVEKIPYKDNIILTSSCSNLEKVLKRILNDSFIKEEISDWLALFIPGFERIEIVSSDLSSTDTLLIYEKGAKKPFTKDLLSDGTYNILSLLIAVFQSDEPQFLCIEEPENGLNPRVIKELVGFFRNACEEKGHYIWLNTHSQTLVSELTVDEIITVDKIKGETKIKQFKGKDFHGLTMDEAWLTNTLGGGLPW